MTLDYALQSLDIIYTEMEAQLHQKTRELQIARQTPNVYGKPEQAQHLMCQIQHLWDRDITSRKQIEALGQEKDASLKQSEALANAYTKFITDNNRLGAHVETLE